MAAYSATLRGRLGRIARIIMPEIVKCPDCKRTLRVPDDLLGKTVRCPSCQVTFTAQAGDPEPRPTPKMELGPSEAPPAPRKSSRREEQIEDRPSRRRRDDEDDDRPRRRRDDDDDDR